MTLLFRFSFISILAVLTLPAATIVSTTILAPGGVTSGGNHTFLTTSGPNALSVSGTIGFYHVNTGNLVMPGDQVDGPIDLRFTNALIRCVAPGSTCMETNITIQAALTFAPGERPDVATNTFGIEGAGNAPIHSLLPVSAAGSPYGQLNLFDLNTQGSFSSSITIPGTNALTFGPPNSYFFDIYMLIPSGVGAGGFPVPRVPLVDGAMINFTGRGAYDQLTFTPEPGSIAMVGIGIALTAWFRLSRR